MMKSLLILMFSLFSGSAFAGVETERITLAIQNGKTSELSAMFNSSIELVTPSSSGISTREQARIMLDNFFRNNPPVKATLVHETSGTSNCMLVISLLTKTGNFRITITGNSKAGNFIINEFRIS